MGTVNYLRAKVFNSSSAAHQLAEQNPTGHNRQLAYNIIGIKHVYTLMQVNNTEPLTIKTGMLKKKIDIFERKASALTKETDIPKKERNILKKEIHTLQKEIHILKKEVLALEKERDSIKVKEKKYAYFLDSLGLPRVDRFISESTFLDSLILRNSHSNKEIDNDDNSSGWWDSTAGSQVLDYEDSDTLIQLSNPAAHENTAYISENNETDVDCLSYTSTYDTPPPDYEDSDTPIQLSNPAAHENTAHISENNQTDVDRLSYTSAYDTPPPDYDSENTSTYSQSNNSSIPSLTLQCMLQERIREMKNAKQNTNHEATLVSNNDNTRTETISHPNRDNAHSLSNIQKIENSTPSSNLYSELENVLKKIVTNKNNTPQPRNTNAQISFSPKNIENTVLNISRKNDTSKSDNGSKIQEIKNKLGFR